MSTSARPEAGIVLALGGGGARGLAHVGLLEVIQREGLRVRAIAGTSIGAEIGAFYAAGVSVEELVRRSVDTGWRQTLRLFLPDLPGGGLVSGRQIVSFFHEVLGEARFQDLKLPFVAVAADLDTGDEVVLDSGPVADAVRASVSLPGVLAPARAGNRLLIDGGAVNPLPADVARRRFGGPVVAVAVHAAAVHLRHRLSELVERPSRWQASVRALLDQPWVRGTQRFRRFLEDLITPEEEPPEPPLPAMGLVVERAQEITQAAVVGLRLAASPPDLLIVPEVAGVGTLEFYRGAEIVEAGRAAAEAALPELVRLSASGFGRAT